MSSTNQMSSYTHSPNLTPWTCVCGVENAGSLDYCLNCRRTREEANVKKVNCPHCGAKNKETNKTCFACGKSMTEEKEQENRPVATALEPETTDGIEILKKLAELQKQGIITEEEFTQKKKEILSRM